MCGALRRPLTRNLSRQIRVITHSKRKRQAKDAARKQTTRIQVSEVIALNMLKSKVAATPSIGQRFETFWLFNRERACSNAGGSSNAVKHPSQHFFFSKFETARLAKTIRACGNEQIIGS